LLPADALLNSGNVDAAIQEFQEVLRINPRNELARDNLKLAVDRKSAMSHR